MARIYDLNLLAIRQGSGHFRLRSNRYDSVGHRREQQGRTGPGRCLRQAAQYADTL